MTPLIRAILLVVVFLFPATGLSDELADHPTWLALLHHDRTDLFGNTRSAIVSRDFFFSPNGSTHPLAELQRTRAMLEADPARYSDNQHPSCRFPARTMWLKEQGLIDADINAQCSSFNDWFLAHRDSRIGLIFADGYLGNPASFFGHLLMHITPEEHSGQSYARLLETSLNFGADIPDSDGLLRYMALGVAGGYAARFSETRFYRNSHLYAEHQMRNLWLYYLDLEQDQRDFLLKHLWELREVEFTYLFLTENCASRIARLIELATSREVLPTNPFWVSPEAVIMALMTTNSGQRSLVNEVVHVPSRRARAERQYASLTPEERGAAHALWPREEEIDLEAEAFRSLGESSRAALLDALLSHVLYLRHSYPDRDLATVPRRLMAARLDLPAVQDAEESAPLTVPVHQMNPPSYLGVSGIVRTSGELGVSVRGRAAQYDLLSGKSARMPYSSLEMLSFDIEWLDGGNARLNDITLFSLTSLPPEPHRLPGGRRLSWHASVAWGESSLLSNDRIWKADLLGGKSTILGDHLIYGLVGLSAYGRSTFDEALGVGLRGGILTNWDARLRTNVFISERLARKDRWNSGPKLSVDARYALAPRMDLTVGIEADRENYKSSLGLLRYF